MSATPATEPSPYYRKGRASSVLYDLYEGLIRPSEPEIAFFRTLAEGINTPILEIGCGTGRVSWPLAEAGFEVVGIDASTAMLELATQKASRHPEEVSRRLSFALGDALSLKLPTTFDLVIAPGFIINHILGEADQIRFLATMLEHLSPTGTAVLDTFQIDPVTASIIIPREIAEGRTVSVGLPEMDMGFETSILAFTMDDQTRLISMVRKFLLKSASTVVCDHDEKIVYRWMEPIEVRAAVKDIGAEIFFEYGDFLGTAPSGVGPRVWGFGHSSCAARPRFSHRT